MSKTKNHSTTKNYVTRSFIAVMLIFQMGFIYADGVTFSGIISDTGVPCKRVFESLPDKTHMCNNFDSFINGLFLEYGTSNSYEIPGLGDLLLNQLKESEFYFDKIASQSIGQATCDFGGVHAIHFSHFGEVITFDKNFLDNNTLCTTANEGPNIPENQRDRRRFVINSEELSDDRSSMIRNVNEMICGEADINEFMNNFVLTDKVNLGLFSNYSQKLTGYTSQGLPIYQNNYLLGFTRENFADKSVIFPDQFNIHTTPNFCQTYWKSQEKCDEIFKRDTKASIQGLEKMQFVIELTDFFSGFTSSVSSRISTVRSSRAIRRLNGVSIRRSATATYTKGQSIRLKGHGGRTYEVIETKADGSYLVGHGDETFLARASDINPPAVRIPKSWNLSADARAFFENDPYQNQLLEQFLDHPSNAGKSLDDIYVYRVQDPGHHAVTNGRFTQQGNPNSVASLDDPATYGPNPFASLLRKEGYLPHASMVHGTTGHVTAKGINGLNVALEPATSYAGSSSITMRISLKDLLEQEGARIYRDQGAVGSSSAYYFEYSGNVPIEILENGQWVGGP